MTAGDGKPCKRCGTSDWYKDSHCKECKRRRTRRWRKNNPEKARAAVRKWRENNPEKTRALDRKWRENNPEKNRTRLRKWRKNNPKKDRARKRKWRKNNPEKFRAQVRRRRARKNNAPGDGVSASQWKKILQRYGNKCLCCGTKDDITMDHVVPLARGGAHDPSNVQPLCLSCNTSKQDKIRDYRKKGTAKWYRQLKLFKGDAEAEKEAA